MPSLKDDVVDFTVSKARELLKRGALIELSSGDFQIGYGSGTQNAFYSPDFFLLSPTPWLGHEFVGKVQRAELKAALENVLEESDGTAAKWSPTWKEPDSKPFFEELQDLKARFEAPEAHGSLKKAVPIVFARAESAPGELDRARLILSLLERSGRARVYGRWDEIGGILGATPETLFEVRPGGIVETMALAGTSPRSEGRDWLLRSEKDLREHQWVINDIRERLSLYGEVSVSQTDVLELPTIYHLYTPIRLNPFSYSASDSRSLEDWAETLHPTPALGGYPRAAAWEWLKNSNERSPVKRDLFGAPFGANLGDGISLCLVAIRNIQWRGQKEPVTWLGSGCGVVEGSDPEREWQELMHKRASVRRMMGLEESSS